MMQCTSVLQSPTQNSQLNTHNPKPKTQNPKPKTQNLHSSADDGNHEGFVVK